MDIVSLYPTCHLSKTKITVTLGHSGGIAMKKLSLFVALLTLSGCTSNEMVQVAAAGLGVAAAVSGASSGGGYSSSGASYGSGSAGVARPTGYSQRGAFEDCQRMYAAAGRYDLAQTCATRASNMSSLN